MKSLTSRTSLITTVAVAGVLVAGTAAIAANIGILNSTNDSSIGSLSATDELVEDPTTTLGTTTTTAATTTTSLPDSPSSESYAIGDAGVVTLSSASGRLTLVAAVPEAGWTVTSSQPDLVTLNVTFTAGPRTLVFTASLGPDGVVTADIVEPVEVMGAPAAGQATSSPTTTIDDDHDDDRYEDDDHDDDHDEYEYEDDDHDDHDEYEGADDDD